MIAHQAPVEDDSLDELTKIADVLEPSPKFEIWPCERGWQMSA